jgi:RNA polymerase sigma-70 factor (ECF subfamily)
MKQTESWERLMRLLSPLHGSAAAFARRLGRSAEDGDDLFQDAILRAHDKLPSLRDEANFRSWFYILILNVHRNRSRRQFWRRFFSLDGEMAPEFDPPGEDGAEWEQERRQAARASRALAGLPAVQREAVVLFELEGFSVEEIANLQNVSVSAVKSRLSRGRGHLRSAYERLGYVPSRRGIALRKWRGVL